MNSNSLSSFVRGSDTIRVVTIDGAPWFVGADVCRALGLSYNFSSRSFTNHYVRLDADERMATSLNGSKGRHTVISESGLYKLVLRSDKPGAKDFQNWVTRTVLPTLRKDGMYVVGEEDATTDEGLDALVTRTLSLMAAKMARLKVAIDNVTLDQYRADLGVYWPQSFASRVASYASRMALARGTQITKVPRTFMKPTGEPGITAINVYPRALLDEAVKALGGPPMRALTSQRFAA
jgi:prophage antirepressor-like protein